jgi:hypothetical protein
VQLLILEDGLQRTRDEERALRLAFIAAGRDPGTVFPEAARTDSGGSMPAAGAEMSGLRWESPGEAGAAADMDLLQQAMSAHQRVVVHQPPDKPTPPPQRSEDVSLDYP